MKPIPYGTQFIDQNDIDQVVETLKSPYMTQGPKVREFEEVVAKYLGCKYAVAFSNGTAALHACYHVSGIKKGETFITSPNTFVASANAGLYVGAVPKFVDIDKDTHNIDPAKLSSALTSDTKVVTPVSYSGYPVDLKTIREIVGEERVIIHDAAHAIGAKLEGKNIIDYADMTILSFHPVKHVATGEGGMVVTNSKEYYKKLKRFCTHGITKEPQELTKEEGPWYYEMVELGYNYRLTDLQSALGISQMRKLNNSLYVRNKIADRYNKLLSNVEWLELPKAISDLSWVNEISPDSIGTIANLNAYHLYPLQVKDPNIRKRLFCYLRENGILVQVHYIPVHLQPYYVNNFGFKSGDYPVAEEFYSKEISLPMFPTLTKEQQRYVVEKLKEFNP
ncbi:UDP-4-amino-4,6-dideoxy-N-acetyl-beta-L-altrosamine transaminase [Enterococcus sp. AZ072]|uniref:UDP-4-amino-4, 6-dideoxy-N-acetyl-beta-L-altrosamine transaminase n=1 Tax=unclassified Enterococcus TaxID=2608891 RepID=UPI003D29AFF5